VASGSIQVWITPYQLAGLSSAVVSGTTSELAERLTISNRTGIASPRVNTLGPVADRRFSGRRAA
jgi:hypothetical protein